MNKVSCSIEPNVSPNPCCPDCKRPFLKGLYRAIILAKGKWLVYCYLCGGSSNWEKAV